MIHPQPPLVARPVHLILALLLVFLWNPLAGDKMPPGSCAAIDIVLIAAVIGFRRLLLAVADAHPEPHRGRLAGVYCRTSSSASSSSVLLLEAVRRTTGWILVWVILAFLAYAFFGFLLPVGGFRGFGLEEMVEILMLTTSGVFGITTETSVTFVFYFIAFGVVFAAIGGGRLFIDLAIRLVGRATGGSQKVAVVGSSLMGTITGSAVANVAAVGVFTIPLMTEIRRPGRARGGDRGDRLDRRAADAAGDGGRRLRDGGTAWRSLWAGRARRRHPGHRLLCARCYILVDLSARKTGVGTLPATERGGGRADAAAGCTCCCRRSSSSAA